MKMKSYDVLSVFGRLHSSERSIRTRSEHTFKQPVAKDERIVLSRRCLLVRSFLSERTKEMIGEETIKRVSKECRRLYASALSSYLPQSPSKKRVKLSNSILPYLDKINANLRARKVPLYFTLESQYQSVLANSPVYFVSVKSVPVIQMHDMEKSFLLEPSSTEEMSSEYHALPAPPPVSGILRHRRHSM